MSQEYQVFPVGYVRSNESGFFLQIERPFIPALKELDSFSHINVLYWFHLCDSQKTRSIIEAEQPYKKSPAQVGIFATRSPIRPNPIALSAVPILRIDHEQGLVEIPYIDATDGSPIIDLKPYHPSVDRIRKVAVPKWCSHWPEWYEDSADFDWEAEFVNAR
jgi:tRNA-Thr(GGU) m(6)t(6)A37 methyltransferase TsaA